MADEIRPNRQGLPITTTSRRTDFGQINPDVDDDLTPVPRPRPRPDGDHNSDGHHHHGHSHDEDIPFSEEDDVVAPGPGDLIDIQNYQSKNFIVNKIVATGTEYPQVLSLKDLGVDDDSSYETAVSIVTLLHTFPTQGSDSILRLAIEPYLNQL